MLKAFGVMNEFGQLSDIYQNGLHSENARRMRGDSATCTLVHLQIEIIGPVKPKPATKKGKAS